MITIKKMIKDDVWSTSNKPEISRYYHLNSPILFKGKKRKNKKLKVVEAFCGCGGTSLGFEMAGYEAILGIDIHKDALNTFKANHPTSSAILGDVRNVSEKLIKEALNGQSVDVFIAGVPCQGFSLNNRKRHSNDERNFLYKEFLRLIKILKPKAVLLENVSGMKSTQKGEFVREIEKGILGAGMNFVDHKLMFAPNYGVPQKRSRLVFVGLRDGEFSFDEVEKTHGPGTKNKYVTIKDAIGDLPSLGINEEKHKYTRKASSKYQKLMRGNIEVLSSHRAPNHPRSTIERIANTKPGDPMYPKFKQRIRLAWDGLSPTQVSGGIRSQFQLGHPKDSRGLSIRERCRIQSFPDSFIVTGGLVQARVQTGNAVPPLLAMAVAKSLKLKL